VYTDRGDIGKVGETLILNLWILRISMKRDSIKNSVPRRLKYYLKLSVSASGSRMRAHALLLFQSDEIISF